MNTQTSRKRWFIKKTARMTLAVGTGVMLHGNNQPTVRVLTYHRFGRSTRDPFCVSVDTFENQMSYLSKKNLTVSFEQFEGFLLGKNTVRPGSILVTIDDGFRSVYSHALPILKYHGIPAVAFITPGLLSQKQHSVEPYLNWNEANQLHESGITIGSHTLTHRSLARISIDQAYEEIYGSRKLLEGELNTQVNSLAYPFGTRADYNSDTASIIKEAGYTCAFTSQHGCVNGKGGAYSLPRVKVEGGEGSWMFKNIIKGGLDAWSWVDKALWRVQASET